MESSSSPIRSGKSEKTAIGLNTLLNSILEKIKKYETDFRKSTLNVDNATTPELCLYRLKRELMICLEKHPTDDLEVTVYSEWVSNNMETFINMCKQNYCPSESRLSELQNKSSDDEEKAADSFKMYTLFKQVFVPKENCDETLSPSKIKERDPASLVMFELINSDESDDENALKLSEIIDPSTFQVIFRIIAKPGFCFEPALKEPWDDSLLPYPKQLCGTIRRLIYVPEDSISPKKV